MNDLHKKIALEPGISIIVCTYNGVDKLPLTIQALAKQVVPQEISWEIIFVDNNSADNSSAVARAAWDGITNKPNIPFISLSESKAGKYYALNRGLKQARYTYFIIVDDDNRLCPDYIHQAFELIDKQPYIGAIGSFSQAVFQDDALPIPTWFKTGAERYAIGAQGTDGDVTYRKHLWGAGLVSRTDLYLRIYEKYPSFLINYSKKDILVVEDTEYCLRLILRGFQLHYSSKLKLLHFIPNQRLSKEYWKKLNYNIDQSFEVIDVYYMAAKLYSKKYKNPLQRLKLKLLTPLRYQMQTGTKKARQRILLGLLFPKSAYSTPLIDEVRTFISDKELPQTS